MAQTLLQSAAIAAVAGAVSSVVTVLVVAPADPHQADFSAPQEHQLASSQADSEDLLEQIDQLVIRNQQLNERLQKLEQQPKSTGRKPVEEWATRDELESLRAELARSGMASAGADSEPQVFEEKVAVALGAIREKEAQDWVEKEANRKAERLEQRLGGMTNWLDLAPAQQDQVRTMLQAKDQRSQELIAMWKNGTDKDKLGEIKRHNEELWRNEVRQVLTADQIQKFNQGMDKPAK